MTYIGLKSTPELLEDRASLQSALNNANYLAGMHSRAVAAKEKAVVDAALTASDEARTRLDVAMSELAQTTKAKEEAELLKAKLAEIEEGLSLARGREKAQEAEDLRKKFESQYTVYKDQCQRVKEGLMNLLRMNQRHFNMTGQYLPGFDESRERWLNLPCVEGPHDDVASFNTGEKL